MDNALPHMLSREDLFRAVKSITNRMNDNGIFVASIRDYDALLQENHHTRRPTFIKRKKDSVFLFKHGNGMKIVTN
jgi:hypothetical protein